MIASKNEKWLLISCLQKSIRKGFEDIACVYAGQLYELDKNYLVHKMCLILLEDIFLGNIDLIDDFFNFSKQKNHKKIDIINFVKSFARSTKDRTAYDLMEIAKIKVLPDDSIYEDILNNQNAFIVDKFHAAKQILNELKLKNPLNSDSNHITKLIEDYEITADQNIADTIKNIYLINKDSNFLLLGFLDQSYKKEKNQKIGRFITGDIINCVYEQELINNKWLLDGIDWHTKEGQSAIVDFLKSDSNIKKLLIDYEVKDLNIAIGLLLFKTVGQEVNKRLFYPTALVASKTGQKLEFEHILNIKDINYSELIKVFKEDYPQLKKCIKEKFVIPDPDSFPF